MSEAHLKREGPGRYTWDGSPFLSVTTILNDGVPKPALKQWSANEAASFAVEHMDDPEFRALPLYKKMDEIRFAHARRSKAAMARGTTIHRHGEQLAAGAAVDVADALRGPVEAYARFMDEWQIEPIAAETPLCNTQYRYAGQADLWARIGRRDQARALIDLKSGGDVWPETALQLAAYRYCDIWQPNGPESESSSVPEVDLVYVAHILPDAVRMVPMIATPAEWKTFLYAQQVARWMRSVARDKDGRAERVLVGEAEVA